jgi:hypothetical protein
MRCASSDGQVEREVAQYEDPALVKDGPHLVGRLSDLRLSDLLEYGAVSRSAGDSGLLPGSRRGRHIVVGG